MLLRAANWFRTHSCIRGGSKAPLKNTARCKLWACNVWTNDARNCSIRFHWPPHVQSESCKQVWLIQCNWFGGLNKQLNISVRHQIEMKVPWGTDITPRFLFFIPSPDGHNPCNMGMVLLEGFIQLHSRVSTKIAPHDLYLIHILHTVCRGNTRHQQPD